MKRDGGSLVDLGEGGERVGSALKLFLFTENRELGPFSTFPPEIVNHISG
jgi:hypothetical protein